MKRFYKSIFSTLFITLFVSSYVIAGSYSYSFSNGSYTTNGGGDWGKILKMTVYINSNNTISVDVGKQSGSFGTSGYMYLQGYSYGESESYNLATSYLKKDTSSIRLVSSTSLDNVTSWWWSSNQLEIYARYESNNGGYAYAGPVVIQRKVVQPAPGTPSSPSLQATGSTSVYISWSSVSYASDYKLYRATSSSGSYQQIYWGEKCTYTDSGYHLSPNTRYYYKVSAGNNSGWSSKSSYKYVTTKKPTPDTPNRPSVDTTGATSNSISWNSVTYADKYRLYRATSSSGSYQQIYYGSNLSYSDSGSHLLPNTRYYYKVSAGNDSGWSGKSSYKYVTTKKPTPVTPNRPSVNTTGPTSNSISWSSVSYADNYKLYRATSSSGSYQQIYYGVNLSYTDSGSHLLSGTRYYYKVSAGNATGWSNQSSYREVTTKNYKPITPGKPSAIANGQTNIAISWNSIRYATLYRLYRSSSSSGSYKQIYYGPDLSYSDSGSHLSPATTYYYKVSAGNETEWSGQSPYCSTTTKRPLPKTPDSPSAQTTGVTSNSILWSSVAYADNYKLFRSTSASGTYKQIYYGPDLTYLDSGSHLSPNTVYYYKLSAGNEMGFSDLSTYCSAKTMIPMPTVNQVSVFPSEIAYGESLSINWSSTDQAWYFFSLYHESNNTPIDTAFFLSDGCIAANANGSKGCLGQQNPSNSMTDSWPIPDSLLPGKYRIQVCVWSSPEQAVCDYSNVFTLANPSQDARLYMTDNKIVMNDLRETDVINRAELATMIYRALGNGYENADYLFEQWAEKEIKTSSYIDIKDASAWYFKPVVYLSNLYFEDTITPFNCISGKNPLFSPEKTISRAWAMKAFLESWNIRALTNDELSALNIDVLFNDVDKTHPAAVYIYKAKQLGLIKGSTLENFDPDSPIIRQDVFLILHRLLDFAANLIKTEINKPQITSQDFTYHATCNTIGQRYEQVISSGIIPPSVQIQIIETLKKDENPNSCYYGLYTSILEVNISGDSSRTFTDPDGNIFSYKPFAAWETSRGSFINLKAEADQPGIPFSRVLFIAPDSCKAFYDLKVFVGDNLGSEVMDDIQLVITDDCQSEIEPVVSMNLQETAQNGESIVIGGTASDAEPSDRAAYGIQSVQLDYSIDNQLTWIPVSSDISVDKDHNWLLQWSLPDLKDSIDIRALARNLQGNTSEIIHKLLIIPNVTIHGFLFSSSGNSVPNVKVELTGNDISLNTYTDSDGRFEFSDELSAGSYALIASLNDMRSSLQVISITSDQSDASYQELFICLKGDVNLDNNVTAQDAVDAFKLSFMMSWSREELCYGDITDDGEITAEDVVQIFWKSFY